jgi:hypothetical protein
VYKITVVKKSFFETGYGPTECFVWELYGVHAEEIDPALA